MTITLTMKTTMIMIGDSDNELRYVRCDTETEIPMDWVNDGMDDCGDNSDEYDDDNSDDGDGDDWNEEPREIILTGPTIKPLRVQARTLHPILYLVIQIY